MISVEQALDIVLNNIKTTDTSVTKKVADALGQTLFEDQLSPIDMPPFRQSAMDGYALCLTENGVYNIIGEVKAGDGHHPILQKGEAVRIFTGAPVPDTANAVIMQEKTSVVNNRLSINSGVLEGDNIRSLGEQVLKGKLALKKGTPLTPAAIAYLSALGITDVKVYKLPSVAIVVTGNELVEPGQNLAFGQIYESNALMLASVLRDLGCKNIVTHKIDDHYRNTVGLLKKVVKSHDLVLISGGISVGDYDFVGKALDEIGVEKLFYQVNQKPGKPLFFGKKENNVVFALPGNPGAALSCFYIYVYPAFQRMIGNYNQTLPKTQAVSLSNYSIKGNRSQFLKAFYNQGKVEILDGQNSSMLHTFALANALVYANADTNDIKINDSVEVILLPIN